MKFTQITFALALVVAFAADARAVTMAWSAVGNPGNPADQLHTVNNPNNLQFGSVAYNYRIGTYEVTNSQYVEFLNAEDATGADSLGLYNSQMGNRSYVGGINFNSGNANGNKYSVISGDGNHPVNNISFYSTLRFINWLNNGQGNSDTETGAYTLLGGTPTPSNGLSITRSAGATIFLPSENEWYKAAYYNPGTNSYFQFPTSSNTAPFASGPTATPNSAHYNDPTGNLTDVGAYTGTTSPFGAFDMGGNVFQWNEALIGSERGERGGSYLSGTPLGLSSSGRDYGPPSGLGSTDGFRVVSIPEPSSLALAAFGFLSLAVWGWRRRRHS